MPWKTESGQAPDPTGEKKRDRRRESGKLRAETENITSISEDLNEFSEEIEANLSKYTV